MLKYIDFLKEGIRWYKNGKLTPDVHDTNYSPTLMEITPQKGDKVLCIKDDINSNMKSTGFNAIVREGDIKVVKFFHPILRRLYFTDTPSGGGDYDGANFVMFQ